MMLSPKQVKIVRWAARILSLAILAFGLPFYFGYGNPLPFIDHTYSFLDNTWLSIFPLMFIGLALGWKFEKTGGWLVVLPIFIGMVMCLVLECELVGHMLVPLAAGVLYLIAGYGHEAH
ncbi:MAG: hypothetical protein K9K66_03425 [Desulfarculaceae bacterium]|nr:hypothetical protein [Desulfarculaceae bacterium]MCF8071099.1 hypothetical protein [Desulfarculaceae bacterium]MCF8100687.1 hypothetical protein [Desulfarculaceae bacterium]MCF8118171.1 hypothetical protein [Desulfarculaceae bacterium]